ncbi:MAG: hypothetical protein ACKVJU_03065 [Verrucomicrobiales bacterium]
MDGYSKFIWGAGLAVGLALATQFSALADEKKKAEGDNFSEKLKDLFPSEAKRGEKSIFRSVKDLDTGDSKKEETKKEPRIVAKPSKTKADEAKKEDKKKEKSKGWASNSKLFGKKSTKAETLVIPEDSLTNKPAPKVEFSKVDTSKDLGDGGDFKSWDDLPYKRKSSVDRMMGKLNIKPLSLRPAAGLPGPRLPGGPSKPASKSE